ncbi:MAG: hypothetical protein V4857_27685 [Pseudomonadota bacterium]
MTILILCLIFGGATLSIIKSTRDNYLAMGVNNGGIDQRIKTGAMIGKLVTLRDCPKKTGAQAPVAFVEVKAERIIYAIPVGNGTLLFCH